MIKYSVEPPVPGVSVSSTGLISAGKIGWYDVKARIVVEIDGKKASKELRVRAVVPSRGEVRVTPTSSSIGVGQEIELQISTVRPKVSGELTDGRLTVTSGHCTWETRRESVGDGTYRHWVKLVSCKDQDITNEIVTVAYQLAGVDHVSYPNMSLDYTNDIFGVDFGEDITAGDESQIDVNSK